MPGDRDDIGSGGYFDYFMVRSRRLEGPAPRTLSGVVERLRTGEKKPFGSTRELLQLMERWGGVVQPPEEDERQQDEGRRDELKHDETEFGESECG